MMTNMKRRTFVIGAASFSGTALLSPTLAEPAAKPSTNSVLLVVDVQNCFLPGGTLAVPDGNEIIPIINALGKNLRT